MMTGVRWRCGGLSGLTAMVLLSGCEALDTLDFDLRAFGDGFDTAASQANLPSRPRPDTRGVISYPNYQVVVAQRHDSVRKIAGRIGFPAEELASYNGIGPDVVLRRDEIIALPRRVAEPSPATGAAASGPILPVAAGAVPVETSALSPAAPAAVPAEPAMQVGDEPIRHRVTRGETVYIISRQYDVPVALIADWNGLPDDLSIREGQFLLIPQGASLPAGAHATPEPLEPPTAPGTGSDTPVPPSAAQPLPDENPAPAAQAAAETPPVQPPDLGASQSAPPASDARLAYPLQGTIIRAYSRGRNDGIDISAAAGSPVAAAAAGEVAAITTDTSGITIVVIRHTDNLFTVYTHLNNLSVERGTNVSQGQPIGQVAPGNPAYLHFEVRIGPDSADPSDYLP